MRVDAGILMGQFSFEAVRARHGSIRAVSDNLIDGALLLFALPSVEPWDRVQGVAAVVPTSSHRAKGRPQVSIQQGKKRLRNWPARKSPRAHPAFETNRSPGTAAHMEAPAERSGGRGRDEFGRVL